MITLVFPGPKGRRTDPYDLAAALEETKRRFWAVSGHKEAPNLRFSSRESLHASETYGTLRHWMYRLFIPPCQGPVFFAGRTSAWSVQKKKVIAR